MKAIQQTTGLLSHPQCSKCHATTGTKVFELSTGNSGLLMSWCPTCAREVVDVLSSAFPEPRPTWLIMMDRLSSDHREGVEQ